MKTKSKSGSSMYFALTIYKNGRPVGVHKTKNPEYVIAKVREQRGRK